MPALKMIIRWHVYKKTIGLPWPGEYWDEAKTEKLARKLMENYYDEESFRLVKVTYEAVPSVTAP